MRNSYVTGTNCPNVTVYILKKTKKRDQNAPQTGYKTTNKTPKITPFHFPASQQPRGIRYARSIRHPHASTLCTDRQTYRQTDIVVKLRGNLLLSYVREESQ